MKMILTELQLAQRRANAAQIAADRRAATHCHNGHEFTPENTYWRKDGRRRCRTCQYDRHSKWYYIQKARKVRPVWWQR